MWKTMQIMLDAWRGFRYTMTDNETSAFVKMCVAQGDYYHLCDDWDDEGCPTPNGIKRAEEFIARARNWTPFGWWLFLTVTGFVDTVRGAYLAWYCERHGHEWVDESYGGPDSGCMAGHCTRCGYAFHHTLY